MITSIHNPRVRAAARLRDRGQRESQHCTIIDGARELGRAIQAGVRLREVFLCPPLLGDAEHQRFQSLLRPTNTEILEVSRQVFERLAFGQREQGIVGVAEIPRAALADLTVGQDAVVAVVEGVEKPGNLGAVLRSADAAGVSALIVADPRTDLYNPNAIRASLGTIFTVPLCAASSDEALTWLRQRQFRVLAARVDGTAVYHRADYRGPVAIALGSEADGLSEAWRGPEIVGIRLPMLGTADSLNLSVTAAVLFYEAWRQRQG